MDLPAALEPQGNPNGQKSAEPQLSPTKEKFKENLAAY
jgi:hypothetical protein